MFTKSSKDMHYGRHVDNPFMSSGRSDLSFTISITNKNAYEGGELIIETINSEKEFKLNHGEIVIYPSTYIHSVNKVKKGETLLIVEAMKVMNNISAPKDGVIGEIFIENAQPVEYDQPLVVIK